MLIATYLAGKFSQVSHAYGMVRHPLGQNQGGLGSRSTAGRQRFLIHRSTATSKNTTALTQGSWSLAHSPKELLAQFFTSICSSP